MYSAMAVACKKSIEEIVDKCNKELRQVDFTDKETYRGRSLNLTKGRLKQMTLVGSPVTAVEGVEKRCRIKQMQ